MGLSVLALVAALAVFFVRTSMQPQFEPCDFAIYYTSSRAWLAGDNPYDRSRALDHWLAAGGNADIMPDDAHGATAAWMPIIGVPSGLPVLAPFALMPAIPAIWIWYVLAACLLVAQTAALASMSGTSLFEPRGLLLLALTLVLSPVHEAFGYANPSGPVISLIILAAWLGTRNREVAAGVLLGLATALKPQLGGPFLLYYALIGRWRAATASAVTAGLFVVIGLAPMFGRGTPWLSDWSQAIAAAATPGGLNSTLPENPERAYMLNLEVVLHGFLPPQAHVSALALLITLALAAVFVWRRGRADVRSNASGASRQYELLSLSAVCVLALLPVYHRYYDGALMLVPLGWGLANLRRRSRASWPLVACALCFIVPIPAGGRVLQWFGIDPAGVSGVWWDALVEPWRAWVLLITFALIVRAMPVAVAQRELREYRPLIMRIASRWAEAWAAVPRGVAVACAWMAALIVALLCDGVVSHALRPYARLVASTDWAHELKQIGHPTFVIILAVFVGVLHPLRWRAASLLVLSAALAKSFYAVQRVVLPRPKPVVMIAPYHLPPLHEVTSHIGRVTEYFWPSGHTTVAFATAAAMSFLLPRGRVAFFGLALMVGAERIAELAHYPSEIVAYAAIGMLACHLARRIHAWLGKDLIVASPDLCLS